MIDEYPCGKLPEGFICNNPPEVCHAGRPWDYENLATQVRQWGEPLPQIVIDTAIEFDLDPHELDWHVEAEHGWEPHDVGYNAAVVAAARCIVEVGIR